MLIYKSLPADVIYHTKAILNSSPHKIAVKCTIAIKCVYLSLIYVYSINVGTKAQVLFSGYKFTQLAIRDTSYLQPFHQTTKIISHFVNTILRSSTVQDISTKTQGQLCASKLK